MWPDIIEYKRGLVGSRLANRNECTKPCAQQRLINQCDRAFDMCLPLFCVANQLLPVTKKSMTGFGPAMVLLLLVAPSTSTSTTSAAAGHGRASSSRFSANAGAARPLANSRGPPLALARCQAPMMSHSRQEVGNSVSKGYTGEVSVGWTKPSLAAGYIADDSTAVAQGVRMWFSLA